VDSKAEYTAQSSTRSQKLKQTAVPRSLEMTKVSRGGGRRRWRQESVAVLLHWHWQDGEDNEITSSHEVRRTYWCDAIATSRFDTSSHDIRSVRFVMCSVNWLPISTECRCGESRRFVF